MKADIDTLTGLIQAKVAKAFETIVNEEIDRINADAQARIQGVVTKARTDAKTMAAQMTIELMRKVDMMGFTLEVKL